MRLFRVPAVLLANFALALSLVALPRLARSQEPSPSPAPTETMMKAVRIHAYGGVDVLQYEDAPHPEPKEDEILIRVLAAGVNPVDAKIRQGSLARMLGTKLPLTPGLDVAGIVETIGAKVTKFQVGDPVYACLNITSEGGYAEFAVAKENEASPKPKGITYESAAAVPVAAATAWQALVEIADLSAGQTVLIHGGSGGVGVFAVQIAKARGAKVIATASAANQGFLKEIGADQAIDYKATKFEEVVKNVDVVLDSVGGDTLKRSYGVLKKGGIVISLLEPPDKAEVDAREIRGTAFMVSPSASLLGELTKLIEAKKLKPVVSKTFPLAEAAQAQEAIETGHTRGKIVLRVAEEPKN